MAKKLTSSKAREILHDKSVHGKPLTEKQRKYFGYIASGGKPKAQPGETLYVSDPNDPRIKSYTDSLNLYKAMQMQDKLMGPGNKPVKPTHKWTTEELKEARIKKIRKGLESYGPISEDFQSEKEQFEGGFNSFTARKEDKKLLDYYRSLGFRPDQIMYHSSPDIVSDKIRAIGSYFDGTAQSPIYKKPVQPVKYKAPEPKKEEQVADTTPVAKPTPTPVQTTPEVNPAEYYGSLEGFPMYINQTFVGVRQRDGKNVLVKPEHFQAMGLNAKNPNTTGAREYILGELKKQEQPEKKKLGGSIPKAQPGSNILTYKKNPEYFDSKAVLWEGEGEKKDSWWNDTVRKKIYAGTHGFNPETGSLVLLDKKDRANVSQATQEQATRDYGKKSYQQRFESDTPAGKQLRKNVVAKAMQDVVKNPITYAPAAMMAAPFVAGTAAAAAPIVGAAMETPIAGVAGLTGSNLLNAGFMYGGLQNIPSLTQSWQQAQSADDYAGATAETLGTGLAILPGAGMLKSGMKEAVDLSKQSGILSNAYKINPFAFKPSPDAYYRKIGNLGYQDAIQSGVVRANPRPKYGGLQFETPSHDAPYFSKGKPWEWYKGDYMAEVKGIPMSERVAYPEAAYVPESILRTTNPNLKFYKKDWLRGYKQIGQDIAKINVEKNLQDLKAAEQFAQQYGYELPKNLERVAESNELTDRTIRGLMNRHNSFVRGVSTNWQELEKRNPEIIRHLEGKGFDLSTEEGTKSAAEYMATHVPINTGYGRASLDTEVFRRGLQGLYTSNSIPTAEGYTYGEGFIVKGKKPTDFSSVNRQDWLSKNTPYYRDEDKFRELMYPLSDEGKYAIFRTKSGMWRPMLGDEKLLRNASPKQKAIKEIEYRIEQIKKDIAEIEPNKDKWVDAKEVLYSKKETIKELESDIKHLEQHGDEILKAPGEFKILRTERSNLIADPYEFLLKKQGDVNDLVQFLRKQPYQKLLEEYNQLGESLRKYSWEEQQPIRAKMDALKQRADNEYNISIQQYMKANHPDYDPVDRYAHYIHLGTPGEKVLQPVKSWRVTPETWKNTSRRHSGRYSKKLSAMYLGGKAKGGMSIIADNGRDIVMPQDGIVQHAESPGYQGLGYSNKGYEYNSAWGGRWQAGGSMPVAQVGKTFLQPTSSKLPMGYAGPVTEPSTERAISIGGENGEPAYLIPTFKYGRLLTDEDAKVEFRRTGEHLGGPFKTWQEAEEFGKIRHQYVEKGQDIPSPIRTRSQYAMGGSLPGATGMMYARTGQDWKPRNISEAGSVIRDDRGQWAHPGEVTKIGSNQITMQGVPYPVMGVSDTGDTQMMMPGGEYQFEGQEVTEYPMVEGPEQVQPGKGASGRTKEMYKVLETGSRYDNNMTFKDLVLEVARQAKIDPRLLFASAFQEGMNLAALSPDSVSNTYTSLQDVDEALNNYPVDGFFNYGLDNFGTTFPELVKKGYLPVDFDFHAYKTMNDSKSNPQMVTTAAFKNNRDALMAKAAYLKHETDRVRLLAKSKGIKLNPEEEAFFAMAFYNGPAQTVKMINELAKSKLTPTQYILSKDFERGQVYKNTIPRYRMMQALKGIYMHGGQIKTIQDMGQLNKLDQLTNFTNYNPHG